MVRHDIKKNVKFTGKVSESLNSIIFLRHMVWAGLSLSALDDVTKQTSANLFVVPKYDCAGSTSKSTSTRHKNRTI